MQGAHHQNVYLERHVRSIRRASPWRRQSMRIARIAIRRAPGCVPMVLTAVEESEADVCDL